MHIHMDYVQFIGFLPSIMVLFSSAPFFFYLVSIWFLSFFFLIFLRNLKSFLNFAPFIDIKSQYVILKSESFLCTSKYTYRTEDIILRSRYDECD